MSKVKETHITNLVRMVNSTYNQVDTNLQILEGENIIETRRLGRARLVCLKFDNPRTIALLRALEMLDISTDGLRKKD